MVLCGTPVPVEPIGLNAIDDLQLRSPVVCTIGPAQSRYFAGMLLDRFVDHLTYEKRYSPHTVSAYRRDLEQFQTFLASFGVDPAAAATDRPCAGG
jgi:hypothetical protein